MFDAGRIAALAWALFTALRARSWTALVLLGLASYVFGLELASGFTVRSEGPLEPIVALLPALIGPTAMPRGHLPPLPLSFAVVHYPVTVDALLAVALFVPVRIFERRIDDLPQFSEETQRLGRVVVALALVAAFECIAAGMRGIPEILDRGAGGELFPAAPWRGPDD